MPAPLRLKGIAASPGYRRGPAVRRCDRRARRAIWPAAIAATRGAPRCDAALASAIGAHRHADGDGVRGRAPTILEFQVAMLEDDALTAPAFAAIADGHRGRRRLGRRARRRDRRLRGVRRRLFPRPRRRPRATSATACCALSPDDGDEAQPAGRRSCPATTSRRPASSRRTGAHGGGIALTAGSAASHVAMLARSRGVPMVVGLGADRRSTAMPRRCSTASTARIVLEPGAPRTSSASTRAARELRRQRRARPRLPARAGARPPTARRSTCMVNIAEPERRRRASTSRPATASA